MNRQCLTCNHWRPDIDDPIVSVCAAISDVLPYRFQYEACPQWSFGCYRERGRDSGTSGGLITISGGHNWGRIRAYYATTFGKGA